MSLNKSQKRKPPPSSSSSSSVKQKTSASTSSSSSRVNDERDSDSSGSSSENEDLTFDLPDNTKQQQLQQQHSTTRKNKKSSKQSQSHHHNDDDDDNNSEQKHSESKKHADVDVDADTDDDEELDYINVSFEFKDPAETDWWSIKALTKFFIQPVVHHKKQKIQSNSNDTDDTHHHTSDDNNNTSNSSNSNTILDPTQFDVNTFADLISNQPQVGTIIHTDNLDNQPIGFITAINMTQHHHEYPIQQILQYLIYHIPTSLSIDKQNMIHTILQHSTTGDKQIALLVNERMINTPTELIGSLHESFLSDCGWAIENSTAEMKQYKYDYLILISKCFYPSKSQLGGSSALLTSKKKRKNMKHQQHNSNNNVSNALYHHFEEEYYVHESIVSYSFDVESIDTDDIHTNAAKEKQSRIVSIIPYKSLQKIVSNIKALFTSNNGNSKG